MQGIPETSDSPSRRVVKSMIAEGYSVREIADALKISTQAVHKHLKKIRREQERQHERRVERVS